MPYLIDGYNLLHSICKVDEELGAISDVQLCYIISRFLDEVDDKGEIIFDGKGPPDKDCFDNIKRVEVIFSGMRTDADTVIENKICSSTAPRGLAVVSSDREIRQAARSRKSKTIKSEEFWLKVQKKLSRKGKSEKEPAGKRLGLSDSETDWWLKFFGFDD